MQPKITVTKERERLIIAFAMQQFMKTKAVTPQAVRKQMGMNDSTFSRLMNGKRSLKFRESINFCDTLGISLDDFGKAIDIMKNDPVFIECFGKILQAEQELTLTRAKVIRFFREKKLIG